MLMSSTPSYFPHSTLILKLVGSPAVLLVASTSPSRTQLSSPYLNLTSRTGAAAGGQVEMAEAALGAAQWVVEKALSPVADGVLGAWSATSNFGLNIEDLRMELLLVKATLQQAARKEICGTAMEELLQRLLDSARNAEDLLDELDYFRIHDELYGTYDAADQHGKGCVCNLALNARHTAKALAKQLSYCFGANTGDHRQGVARQHVGCCAAWPPNSNQAGQELSGCMPKLGKLLPCSSSPHPHVHGDQVGANAQGKPMHEFNRVDFSQRMKDTVQQLKLMRNEVTKILQGLEINGEGDLHNIDQVLVFDKETGLERLTLDKCPPLELKHLLMLTSLNRLIVRSSVGLVGSLGGGQSDVEWQLPVEHIWISGLNGNVGEELTELLPHLPKLSKLEIWKCKNIKKLVVGVDVQQTTREASEMRGGEITAAAEEEDDGVLLFPPHLCDKLRVLEFYKCEELVLVDLPTLVPGGGGLQALRSLQRLAIQSSPKFLSTFSFSCHIFPSSLQFLDLWEVEGMGTLEPLSNLTSLTILILRGCGEDLKRQGLLSLLTTGGQLKELRVMGSPRFFVDWDPNPRRALEVAEGGEEQQTQLVSSTLQELSTDDIAGLLAAPVCRFLSSSVTKLALYGHGSRGMERFSKEQEDALQLLSSLQELEFSSLQQLPAGLRNLTSLKILSVNFCPAISSLPNDALPDSLEKLYVGHFCSEELKQYCRGLEGTIPEIIIE
ncbi:hypothetical protein ZWY2020_046373 [Hordeum vulgare]|nr:hypothetical protein ZWY2020_046373 [Hordeum vulgare]